MNTTELVVEIRPERNSGHLGFEPMTSAIPSFCLIISVYSKRVKYMYSLQMLVAIKQYSQIDNFQKSTYRKRSPTVIKHCTKWLLASNYLL